MDIETTALLKKLLERNLPDDEWDRQMKRDVRAGKLDDLIEEAIPERDAGEARLM